TKEQLRAFIAETPGPLHKRDIARAFQLFGDDRIVLRRMLRELEDEGVIGRVGRKRTFAGSGLLPEVGVVVVTGVSGDGGPLARPLTWTGEGPAPVVTLIREKGRDPLGVGDRVLTRLRPTGDNAYEGRPIRRIGTAPTHVLGVFEPSRDGGRLRPTDRRDKSDYLVAPEDTLGAASGELVLAEPLQSRRFGLRQVRVVERIGNMADPKSISLIAIHAHGIPAAFSPEALRQAAGAVAAPEAGREDLRRIPLITIDGEDARDFDDAVWAEPDPDTPDGWHILVAIADVSWYVRPSDPLDRTALERGNSVYFPDRVVPMLPEALSNGWCSLKPGEDRPCLAVHMWIGPTGEKTRHRFVRGLMRSAARLTYHQVQNAIDGIPDDASGPLADSVLRPLYGAYAALKQWRERRGTLELDLPERKIVLDESGNVVSVEPRARHDSHRLIEEFMIAANVAAAEQIEALDRPCMYRIHDRPSPDKLDALREFLSSIGMKIAGGQTLTGGHFNHILSKAAGTPSAHLVNEVVLRSQSLAEYNPANIGHFGLGLSRYAHFTSPIRRYADLLVHRALIAGLGLGPGGLPPDAGTDFPDVATRISAAERRAAAAERDAVNRFAAAFMAERVGATFAARVNGVSRAGLFVTVHDSGADGLVPIGMLGDEYFVHDPARHCLTNRRGDVAFRLGDPLKVILVEAEPVNGSLIFSLADGRGTREAGFRPRGGDRRRRR
ncbi:MAG: ribonuclease R, partial [Alphaproteobacteria bacterium]|nr:ribonuclease R [Alphaproteobacteria bacterium]